MRKYLIIPSRPTPNGPLHLGHIAGPYLRADIMARHLKRMGHSVKVITGSDVHESYVLLKALQENSMPEEVVFHYHNVIQGDLLASNIVVDKYVNILEMDYYKNFMNITEGILNKFRNSNNLKNCKEKILYNLRTNTPILGCWLSGKCPNCQSDIRGFFCEVCGAHFRPDEVNRNQSVNEIELTLSCSYLINVNQKRLLKDLYQKKINIKYLSIVEKHIKNARSNFRLSHPGLWGAKSNSFPSGQVLFSAASILNYCILYGEIYQNLENHAVNPFAIDSDITTMAFFGKDATIPYLYGHRASAYATESFKPFDHLIINEFYNLGSGKFSTSSGNAIWVKNFIAALKGNSDQMRYYLTTAKIDVSGSRFNLDEFINLINTEYLMMVNKTMIAMKKIQTVNLFNFLDIWIKMIEQNLQYQEKYLSCTKDYYPYKVVKNIFNWVKLFENLITYTDHYWWLKGLALLSYPIIPKFSNCVWHYLGEEGVPCLNDILKIKPVKKDLFKDLKFIPLTREGFSACIPKNYQN